MLWPLPFSDVTGKGACTQVGAVNSCQCSHVSKQKHVAENHVLTRLASGGGRAVYHRIRKWLSQLSCWESLPANQKAGKCDIALGASDGLMVENMNDIPYTLNVGPEVTASMATVCYAVKKTCQHLPLGVQVLACANQQALAVALAAGADFIRAESFVFSHVADEGLVNACAGDLLRYRKAIGADHIQIFADIKKKHSSHAVTSDVSISETAKAAEFFLADGVILTGVSTGREADPRELKEVQRTVQIPVLIGSGVTLDNVDKYTDANALIIGSHFKHHGDWRNNVNYDKVMAFMDKISKLRD
ncbi:uncharacterized protein F13E9.13, mitochondrial-like isoform X2 [Dendropsophus ebraccatus]|uniref:uncharacterized protein F13E9.13, mitochondrial-like isoform X2 n=1 Tax=Dendropsophus ebraccatus TaxID=150705 RepID=UPI0038322CEB